MIIGSFTVSQKYTGLDRTAAAQPSSVFSDHHNLCGSHSTNDSSNVSSSSEFIECYSGKPTVKVELRINIWDVMISSFTVCAAQPLYDDLNFHKSTARQQFYRHTHQPERSSIELVSTALELTTQHIESGTQIRLYFSLRCPVRGQDFVREADHGFCEAKVRYTLIKKGS